MENTENTMELNLEEMAEVSGGKCGGYSRKPGAKAGCKIHKVVHGETLTKIATRYGTTVKKIMSVNPELTDPSFIVSGCYIYVPSGR